MDRQYYPIVGVENIYIAKNVVDSESGYSAGTPAKFAPGQKVDWATEQGSEALYADNLLKEMFFGTKKESAVFTITGLSEKEDAELRGIYHDEASGRSYSTGDEEPPHVAVGFKINKGKSDYVYVWFLKGTLSGGNVVAETKKDNVTISTREYTFNGLITDKKWTIDEEPKGLCWVKGDTSTEAFDGSSWFNQVQTPDTVSAPSAIALSSIVPADGAENVAVDSIITLTFNNKIAEEAITVLDTSTGDIVAVSKSWDTTGKVLAITPSENYGNDTVYAVAVAGVKDIYGQQLSAQGKNFTTIAA